MRLVRIGGAVVCAAVLVGCGTGGTSLPAVPSRVGMPSIAALSPHAAASPTGVRSSAATDPLAASPLIATATWTTTDKGRQLQVVPTHAGRTDLVSGADLRAWSEVLAKAPDAGSPGMYDQFLCHWDFARVVEPNKPSWNLEPWRPAVGYAKTVAASCNPGGAES